MRDLIEEFQIIINELICIRNINANLRFLSFPYTEMAHVIKLLLHSSYLPILYFNNITVDDLGTQSINSALRARNNPSPAW